jgi:hypothetical protein
MSKSLSGKTLIKKSRGGKRALKKKIEEALKRFTPRQLKYRQNRLSGMSIYAAARAAGYGAGYSRAAASQRLERLVKDSIIDELEMSGATNRAQAQELTRIAFRSMTTEKCRVYRKEEDGDIVVEDAGREIPDDHARMKALDQIGRLKKQLTTSLDKALLDQNFTRLTIVVEKESADDNRPANSLNPAAEPRVALTDG